MMFVMRLGNGTRARNEACVKAKPSPLHPQLLSRARRRKPSYNFHESCTHVAIEGWI